MPQSVVTAELKEQAVELAKQDNASQEVVDHLMTLKAKDLVKWMKERKTKAASPPSGEVEGGEDSGAVPVNRFSAFS